ncbi:MAG: DJ-1 family glyoxalase III [Planctomycetota bacterium]|jgi:DJ-1 family protein
MANVLIVLCPGAEEIETVTVADVLVRAGCTVTIAGSTGAGLIDGSRGIPLGATVSLDDVRADDYDCVYLPGGMGSAETCRDDVRIQTLIEKRLSNNRLLAIICAAPIALIPSDRARGRRLTSYPAVAEQLTAAGATWCDQAVVEDGTLITSQGPGTACALALTLAARLRGEDVAADVAAAMLAPLPNALVAKEAP